tara:strand:+ start:147 stop:422 length:276 start_codon:yes stop_codon:yes gene_type:complete
MPLSLSIHNQGWSLFRLNQEWVYNNITKEWMPRVLVALANKTITSPDRTLVLLDIHREFYKKHAEHWMNISSNSIIRTYKVEELKKECKLY